MCVDVDSLETAGQIGRLFSGPAFFIILFSGQALYWSVRENDEVGLFTCSYFPYGLTGINGDNARDREWKQ